MRLAAPCPILPAPRRRRRIPGGDETTAARVRSPWPLTTDARGTVRRGGAHAAGPPFPAPARGPTLDVPRPARAARARGAPPSSTTQFPEDAPRALRPRSTHAAARPRRPRRAGARPLQPGLLLRHRAEGPPRFLRAHVGRPGAPRARPHGARPGRARRLRNVVVRAARLPPETEVGGLAGALARRARRRSCR